MRNTSETTSGRTVVAGRPPDATLKWRMGTICYYNKLKNHTINTQFGNQFDLFKKSCLREHFAGQRSRVL